MARGIKSWQPVTLLLYYLCLFIWFIIVSQPVFQFVSLLVLIVLHLILDDGKTLREWRGMLIFMGLFFFLSTVLFNQRGNTVLFYLFDRPIVLEAFFLGIQISLSFLNLVLLSLTLKQMFPTTKLLYLLRKVSYKWALLLMISLRYIPSLKRKLEDMLAAQRQKQIYFDRKNWRQTMKAGMQAVKMLLTSSLEDSILLADSMTARGFSDQKRTSYHEMPFDNQDKILLLMMLILNLFLLKAYQSGILNQELNPAIEPLLGQPHQWFYLLVWLILVSLPLISEGKELIKWQYTSSKI